MDSSSEDEFEREHKKLKSFEMNKENVHPNIERKSPLLAKLVEIGFDSPDFMDNKSKRAFDLLLKNTPAHKLGPCTTKQIKKIPKKENRREPYAAVRVKRPGITMFELMKQTDTSGKVVQFLQEHGCLATNRLCPRCNTPMIQTERADTIQTHIFRCSKRHGPDKPRCQVVESVTKGSFFSMRMFLYSHWCGYCGVFVKGWQTVGMFDI